MWGQLLFISAVGLFLYTQLKSSPVDSSTVKATSKKQKPAKKKLSTPSSLPTRSLDSGLPSNELDIRATSQHQHDGDQAIKRFLLDMLQHQSHEGELDLDLEDEELDRHFFDYDSDNHGAENEHDNDHYLIHSDDDDGHDVDMMAMDGTNDPMLQQQLAALYQNYLADVKQVKNPKASVVKTGHQTVIHGEEGEDEAWSDVEDDHPMNPIDDSSLAFLSDLLSKAAQA